MDSKNSLIKNTRNFLEYILQSNHNEVNVLYNIFDYKISQFVKSIIRHFDKKAVDIAFDLNDGQDQNEIFSYFGTDSEDGLKQKILEILNSNDFMDEKSLNEHAILQDFAKIDVKYTLTDYEGAYFVADLLDDKNLPIAINLKMAKLIMDTIANDVEEK